MPLENNEYNAHGSIGSMQLTHTKLKLPTFARGHTNKNFFDIETLMHVHLIRIVIDLKGEYTEVFA